MTPNPEYPRRRNGRQKRKGRASWPARSSRPLGQEWQEWEGRGAWTAGKAWFAGPRRSPWGRWRSRASGTQRSSGGEGGEGIAGPSWASGGQWYRRGGGAERGAGSPWARWRRRGAWRCGRGGPAGGPSQYRGASQPSCASARPPRDGCAWGSDDCHTAEGRCCLHAVPVFAHDCDCDCPGNFPGVRLRGTDCGYCAEGPVPLRSDSAQAAQGQGGCNQAVTLAGGWRKGKKGGARQETAPSQRIALKLYQSISKRSPVC
jgi:hypothetical protein